MAEGDFGIKGPSPTFEAFAREWLEQLPTLRDVRLSTLENYRSFTERHLVPSFGCRPVSDITTEAIEAFIAAKRGADGSSPFPGKPLARSTLRVGLVALRLILQRAVKARYLAANPVKELDRLPRGDNAETVDPFTTKELAAILTAAPEAVSPDFATMLRLWAQTGLRAGETCGLQWQDLDLEQGTALIQRTYSRQRVGPTKTGRVRKVSFLHPIADETAEWRPGSTVGARSVLTGLRRLTVRSLELTAFVFGAERPVSSADLHRDWRRVLRAAKVRYRSPEQLRHTFASTMLSRNAPLLYVQQQGGWRSAAVLLRVYARWMPQDVPGNVAPEQPAATPAQPPREAVSVTR